MVKSDFQGIRGAKTERFSHSQFRLEIQALYGSAGKGAFGRKPVHDQGLVVLEHPGHFFHGLKFCAHGAFAPAVQEPSRDRGVLEFPEPLEVFPQEIGLDRLDVELQEIRKTGGLSLGQVFWPFQKGPPGFLKNALSKGLEGFVLFPPDLVDRFAELLHDVKAVEDVQGLWSALPDRVKERRPHVGTDVFEAGAPFLAELLEERQKGVGFPVGPAPEKAPNPCIQLVDQREVFVALEDGNLVDSDLGDALQRAVLQAVVHHVGDGPIHTVPTCPEHPGRFAPGQSPGPASQKELVVVGQLFFSRSPGESFDMDPVERTVHTARRIEEEDLEVEQGQILEGPGRLEVIPGAFPAAFPTDRPSSFSGSDLDNHNILSFTLPEKDISKDKGLETDEPIQYSLHKHCSSSKWLIVLAKTIIPNEKGNALLFYPQILRTRLKRFKIKMGFLAFFLGIGWIVAAQPAFATTTSPLYGVDLSASAGGTIPLYNSYGPNETSGSIPSSLAPGWTGSVNILTGQISAGTTNGNSELLYSLDKTYVEGWNTVTFHGPTGSSIDPTFEMTGNFSSTSRSFGLSRSSGTGAVCLGLSIGGCNANTKFGTSQPNFSVDLPLSNITNNDSVLLSYSLTTTAPSFGTSAVFDPIVGFILPTGWSVTGAAGGIAATPEPSSIALFGTGILLMSFLTLRGRSVLRA